MYASNETQEPVFLLHRSTDLLLVYFEGHALTGDQPREILSHG